MRAMGEVVGEGAREMGVGGVFTGSNVQAPRPLSQSIMRQSDACEARRSNRSDVRHNLF